MSDSTLKTIVISTAIFAFIVAILIGIKSLTGEGFPMLRDATLCVACMVAALVLLKLTDDA